MRVRVDHWRCQGHGRCYTMFPDIFDEDEHGHGVVSRMRVEAEQDGDVLAAVGNCPESAIVAKPDGPTP